MQRARIVLTIAIGIVISGISSHSQAVASAKLTFIGLAGGERQSEAEKRVRSEGFTEADCPAWRKQGTSEPKCFSKGTSEKLTLSFIDGRLSMADYDFRLARYDEIRNSLVRQLGAPRPFHDGHDGSWVYDFWRNTDGTIEIDISKRLDGTGYVSLDAVHLVERAETEGHGGETASANPVTRSQQQHGTPTTECPTSSDDCIVTEVLSATLISLTTSDPNGYIVSRGKPVQRLTVSLHGKKPSDGAWYKGQNYRTADILCLQNCTRMLTVGKMYRMRMGVLPTLSVQFIYPYLTLDNEQDGGVPAWQILELCPQDRRFRCVALSTINDR